MNILNNSSHISDVYVEIQYCYDSVSGSCKKNVQPLSLQFSMFAFMAFAILVTVTGNLLVITSIAHFKQLHTTTNCLILSLAVCDFLMGAFVMPCSAMRSVYGCWYLGDFVCKFHSSMDIMLSTSSTFHLSFISVDRYFAVCTPLLYHSIVNSVTALLMIITSWVFPAIFAFGMIFSGLNMKGSEHFFETQVQCVGGCTMILTPASAAFSTIFAFFLPGLIMFSIYLKIYMVARRQARSIKDLTRQIKVEDGNGSAVSRKQERKKAETLAVVVGVFLFCFTPFFLCSIMDPFIGYSIPPTLIDALVWFGYMNSGFNPFIYAFFYSWFRKALRLILSGKILYRDSCRMKLYS
ncbi:trace amine-associated receptor 1-like [Brienomyrus brachyistius]|uniref:trace amine-associated receptor 1-like n=1 Tax=Brienomyrus brachyistius TaxID=42636 RepID=UPI0020B2A2B4|nr:trace amine-associated receptor 1-like [Brienomyrus brachyistius]